MVARISQCDQSRLELALAGRLTDAQAEDLGRHLQSCPHCRAELEQMAGGQQCWDAIKEHLSQQDAADSSTAPRIPGFLSPPEENEAELPLDFLMPSDQPGMLGRLGSYEIEEVIGRGGMGIVLKAQDTALNRCVAIKVMAGHLVSSAAARKRFAHEAQAAAAVVHDHVIPIYAVDASGPTPLLVMPYVAGRSLQDRLDACGVLEIKEVLRIAMQTARGLAAAHAQGLIHRDIKPANILLDHGVERVRITDFGLARASDDASQTQSGFIAGTPQYMSPEQARGAPLDTRADLFSLGSVMYAMCTGHSPFRADTTLAVLRRICDDVPRNVRELNPNVPLWLARIIAKLHAKSPADRFQTADEVATLLEKWLAHLQQPTMIGPPEVPSWDEPQWRWGMGTRRSILAVGGLGTLMIIFLMASGLWSGKTPSDEFSLHGTWKVVSGETMDKEWIVGDLLTFGEDDWLTFEKKRNGEVFEQSNAFSIDPTKSPMWIDIKPEKKSNRAAVLGIYELKGEHLIICLGREGGNRPTGFGKPGTNSVFMFAELARQKSEW